MTASRTSTRCSSCRRLDRADVPIKPAQRLAEATARALDSRRGFLSDLCGLGPPRPEPHESLREPNMTAEASEPNLSMEEAAILDVALGDGTGELVIMRPYGKAWGADHAMVKRLEARGFMRFKCDGRAPQTRDYLRTSSITDSGRAAAGRVAHGVVP